MLIVFLFILIFGLVVGSFLNVLIYRIPRNESISYPPSHCPACKKKILARDLIPVLSYVYLRGNCRYCRKHISLQYPLVEGITGILFVLSFFHALAYYPLFSFSFFVLLVTTLSLISLLVVLFMIDAQKGILPFTILFPAMVLAVIHTLFLFPIALPMYFYTAIGSGLFFLAIFFLTKGRGMGFGDVVYAFFMGLLLGYPFIFLGLYIAFLTGAVISIILIVRGKKRLQGGTIAFGPFLILGTIVMMFWGDALVRFVNSFFFHLS